MLHKRSAALILAMTLPVLAGCVQATRHSNTMVFGTNTTFGIKAGTATAETPSIIIGYDRQEAVIMPLVANISSTSQNNRRLLEPCDLTKPITAPGNAPFAVHPCSLVGVNGKALDSYSVLASFGADFDASGQGAKGGLAQYFSTGIASQILAATGGASVVSTGNAAAVSAAKASDTNQTLQSLYGDNPSFQLGVASGDAYTDFNRRLSAKIELTDKDQLQPKMTAFESAVGSGFGVADACTDRSSCKSAAFGAFSLAYKYDPTAYETALTAWKID